MSTTEIIFYVLTGILVNPTLLPLVKSPKWYIRVFDYPRFQMFGLILILIIVSIFIIDFNNLINATCLVALSASLVYLCFLIYPYTFFSTKMVESEKSKSPDFKIKLLTINVYQYNTEYAQTIQLIGETKPDIIFLLETSMDWKNELQEIKKDYSYFIEIPKENTYGMLFYSKFPIEKQEVNYLIDEEIPSILININVNGKTVRLYGIHPTPPVPQENPESTDRDAEILIVGKKSKDYDGPSIVLGDLNDVAWSHTTRLFLRISGMLDPRIGRGMFNTFHAKYPFFRWPLAAGSFFCQQSF